MGKLSGYEACLVDMTDEDLRKEVLGKREAVKRLRGRDRWHYEDVLQSCLAECNRRGKPELYQKEV